MEYIYGTNAAEIISGTNGPDIIDGRQGSDSIHGLRGKDIFVIDSTDYKKFIIDFEDGRDLVDLRAQDIDSFRDLTLLFEYATDIVESMIAPLRLYLNLMNDPEGRVSIDHTDFIFASTPVHEYSGGRDVVELSRNVYSVHFGNGGQDALSLRGLRDAGDGASHVWMDAGRYGTGKFEVGNVVQHFFEFRDILGTHGRDIIVADAQDNRLIGRAGWDSIAGRDGDDRIVGGNGNDRLFGGRGNDTLAGNGHDDLVKGGNGRDQLAGGHGDDQLFGGWGADLFVFYASDRGVDRVMDFQDGIDRLDVSRWGVDGRDDLHLIDNGDGSVTVQNAQGDQSFVVHAMDGSDLDPWQLSASDFVFG